VDAGTLIDEARDHHPSFTDRHHPNKGLLRQLERREKEMLRRALEINEDYQSTTLTTALPLAVFGNGITLPTGVTPTGADYLDANGDRFEIELRPWSLRGDPAPLRAAYVKAGVVYLRGVAADWNGLTSILIYHTPVQTPLVDKSSVLTVGDEAKPHLVADLAYFMARRGHTDQMLPQPSVNLFAGEREDSWEAFEHRIAEMRSGESFHIRETW
jgi:hypothetical protein